MQDVPNIVRASYAELRVTDLARARWFWSEVLGMVVEEETADALYLRGFDELTHHNVVLRQDAVAALSHVAYRVRNAADLVVAERFFTERGCTVRRMPAGATRGVGEAVRVEDPFGFVVEFFHDISLVERLGQRYELRRGAEVSRLDHFNLIVPDVRAAYDYYESLGFGASETIEDENTIYAAWLYRKQTVHDVSLTGGDGPRLHHIGMHVNESQNVLRICDILGSLGEYARIERGPGRHGVSNAFYVYLRDPDGHRVEIYTSDYYTGDPGHPTLKWDVTDPRRRDYWANAVPDSWYEEGSAVLDLDGVVKPLARISRQQSEMLVGADGLGLRKLVPDHQ